MEEAIAPTTENEAVPQPGLSEASPVMTTERLSAAFASLQAELEVLHHSTSEQEKRFSDLEARDAALRDHAAKLTDREFHLAERHRELNAAQEQLLQDAGTWRQREADILAREQAIQERESAPPPPAPIAEDAFATCRRARLKKQRRLLAERAAQLVRAKEAIANRLADTARTRTSLPMAGGALPPPSVVTKPAPAQSSRMGAFGMGMFAASLSIAAIAGVSWWLAGLVDQPRYSAQTTIGMANQAKLDDSKLAESWSDFHQQLATDPQLLEQAADRLMKRGYEEFATPSDLRRLIDESMSIDASTPGRLSLSMNGAGRQRTERILETYTSVLVGMANDSRERRADQSSTIVMVNAKSGEEPVSDHRLPIFGVAAGGLLGLCLAAGLGGMSLAGRSGPRKNKVAVENDGDEERWSIR